MKPAWIVLVIAAAGLAACTDRAIEMTLALPSEASVAGFDLSCVGAVSVVVVGNDVGDDDRPPDELGDCVDLAAAPKTFADVQRAIAGRFALALPRSGLAGVQLSGWKGGCNDRLDSREAVFYGGAPHAGSDRMTIPLVANISCDKARTYSVHAVDLSALTATKTCTPPTDQPLVFAGDIHPVLLGDDMPRMMLEWGASEVQAPGGLGTVASYAAAYNSRSCIAVGYEGTISGGAGCVNPAAPTLCGAPGAPGELEVASLALPYAAMSTEDALTELYGEPVFGAVWEPSDVAVKAPIANATVELVDPTQGKVFYLQRGATQFTRLDSARGTGADGLFVAYVRGDPTNLTVKAAGHATQTLRVASTPDWPSTVLAVLPRL
jgi:hypothetical protein